MSRGAILGVAAAFFFSSSLIVPTKRPGVGSSSAIVDTVSRAPGEAGTRSPTSELPDQPRV